MFLNIFQQLRQAARVVLDVEVDRVVEADAVDVEVVDPVEADIANELLGAAVVIIEIEQAGETSAKGADVRTGLGILVQPAIRKALGFTADRILIADVIEHTVHDHMNAARVTFAHQPLEPRQAIDRGVDAHWHSDIRPRNRDRAYSPS